MFFQEVWVCSLVISSLCRKGLVCHQCSGFRMAERLHTSQRTRHSGPSGSRVGQTDRRTRGHSIHRKLRNPSRPRCWTYAHGTETAQASRHERRIDISWRHTFLASMGKAVASLFISRFERKMRTGDGRGTSSLGAEQNSTQRGRPSRRMDSVHSEFSQMVATDGGGRASRAAGLGGDDVLSGVHVSGRRFPCPLRVLMRLSL